LDIESAKTETTEDVGALGAKNCLAKAYLQMEKLGSQFRRVLVIPSDERTGSEVKPIEINDQAIKVLTKNLKALTSKLFVKAQVKPGLTRKKGEIIACKQTGHRAIPIQRKVF
jgi:hypothetical protein